MNSFVSRGKLQGLEYSLPSADQKGQLYRLPSSKEAKRQSSNYFQWKSASSEKSLRPRTVYLHHELTSTADAHHGFKIRANYCE